MATKRIEQWEVERYWEIFSSLSNGGSHLTGSQAATVLKNSQLRDDQLERVWDLADVDNDGNLDFEEFCVAMRLIFDLVNGEYADVPRTLPDWLIPESKSHLVQATHALSRQGGEQFERPDQYDDDDDLGLKDGFDWYMSAGDKEKYEEIWEANRDRRGELTFASLNDLYSSLSVPDTDIRSAWNLINPNAYASISHDAALAFLHILNQRHEGYRVPRTVPASLRASFERGDINYDLNAVTTSSAPQRSRYDESTSTGRKQAFGDAYLGRIGRGGASSGAPGLRGTDFSSPDGGSAATTEDWEEVRLKRQLATLENRISEAEQAAEKQRSRGRRSDDSKPALVKRELELMLDYKRRVLSELRDGNNKGKSGDVKGIEEDVKTVREQVESLEAHLAKRQADLRDLRSQVDAER